MNDVTVQARIRLFISHLGIHFVEMTMRLPKSGSIYTYTYSTLGEFFAFIIGWIAIFDYAVCAAYVVKAWSQHLNYVFNKNPHEFINPYVHHLGNDTVWDEKFDALALLGLLSAAAIVSCSVKVTVVSLHSFCKI